MRDDDSSAAVRGSGFSAGLGACSANAMRSALLALEDAARVIGAAWADSVAHQPIAALRAALDHACDDIDILAAYSRSDGRREWVSVGTWLRHGEVVVHMDDPRHLQASGATSGYAGGTGA